MRPAPEQPSRAAGLTQTAFVLAAALIIGRATIVQGLRDPDLVRPDSPAIAHTAGATTGLVLDLLTAVPAILILARRALDADYRLRLGASHVLLIVLALLAAISPFWSSDKFAAAVTSAHFLSAAVLFWSMSQLVRSWTRLRIVAGICFGLLLVYTAQGIIYRTVDLPDNVRYWEANRDAELALRGWEPGSFQATQFERRIRAGETVGFFTSPNTLGAMIVLLATISAGAAIQRIRDRDEPGWAAAIIVAIIVSTYVLYFTGCRTAAVTPLIAASIIALAPRAAHHRKGIYIACIIATFVGTAMLIGHGLFHGSLIVQSLTYRWRYWVGAKKILSQHPFFGVGWSNFGNYYLGVRLPAASEEIKDPHNFVVRAAVELGITGGALMLAWLARFCWESTTPATPQTRSRFISPTAAVLSIGVLGLMINVVSSVDFLMQPLDIAWVFLELFKRLLFLFLLVLGLAAMIFRSSTEPRLDERPCPWLLISMLAGIAVFLVHNLIDFSLFEPGAMFVFIAICGAVLGARTDRTERAIFSRAIAAAACAVATILWMAVGIGFVAPIAVAEQRAAQADNQIRSGRADQASIGLQEAFQSLWIPNADYAYRSAVAMQYANLPAEKAAAMLDAAIAADPMSPAYHRARATLELRQTTPNEQRVIDEFQQMLSIDPNDVSAHLDFADALARFGDRQRAVEQYQAALKYNDLLDPTEIKRLPSDKYKAIEEKIRSLQ
ncbi:MAG TPA: O-antigen ligase family protein [Tepidisphaeraceae bacterium]|nr:O-antigen ligase family protein [Tepidisphaeraceae bacterium]